jgi:steroid 5-alpha reductase family enzyme
MGYGTVMVVSAAAIAALMLFTWLLSVRLRDASVADMAWGLGFVLVAWASFAIADGAAVRKALVVTLTTLWGLRLAGYLALRKIGEGEDFRYQAMRRRYGKRFPLVSLFLVFGFQGLGMWAVSLPIQAAQVPGSPSGLTAVDLVGVAIWSLGFFFETVGDLQLARFRADPGNRGKVMDRGLWRYTRHPNYFGDFCVWWGLYALALATGDAWWSVIGPLVMSCVLLRLSGVPVLEGHLTRHREGYRDYALRTSAFFPWPPGSPPGRKRSDSR